MWYFPTSKWAWILVATILLFAAVFYFNPRYKYWHRASWCFGIAGVLGLLPTFTLKANVEGVAAIEFLSESSPITVLDFSEQDWCLLGSTRVSTAHTKQSSP
ncbi:MAG: hypothetical protein R3C19_15330 [Planctomycetaceae bacterium]